MEKRAYIEKTSEGSWRLLASYPLFCVMGHLELVLFPNVRSVVEFYNRMCVDTRKPHMVYHGDLSSEVQKKSNVGSNSSRQISNYLV